MRCAHITTSCESEPHLLPAPGKGGAATAANKIRDREKAEASSGVRGRNSQRARRRALVVRITAWDPEDGQPAGNRRAGQGCCARAPARQIRYVSPSGGPAAEEHVDAGVRGVGAPAARADDALGDVRRRAARAPGERATGCDRRPCLSLKHWPVLKHWRVSHTVARRAPKSATEE